MPPLWRLTTVDGLKLWTHADDEAAEVVRANDGSYYGAYDGLESPAFPTLTQALNWVELKRSRPAPPLQPGEAEIAPGVAVPDFRAIADDEAGTPYGVLEDVVNAHGITWVSGGAADGEVWRTPDGREWEAGWARHDPATATYWYVIAARATREPVAQGVDDLAVWWTFLGQELTRQLSEPPPATARSGRRLALIQRRRDLGKTQDKLAAEVGVLRSTVARWESGHTTPSPRSRPRLATALDLSPDALDTLLSP